MHGLFKIVGSIPAFIGAFVAVYGLLFIGHGPELLIGGIALIVSGAMMYCFGSIVKHLAAIRELQERQTRILENFGR